MIGDDLAEVLPELQAEAESLMRDSCTITAAGSGAPAWSPTTGEYGEPRVTIYAGRCQLGKIIPAPQDAEAGEASYAKGIVPLKLPARLLPGATGNPLAVADGHRVVITTKAGLELTVRGVSPQTYEKSRKVTCEVVSRDAGRP